MKMLGLVLLVIAGGGIGCLQAASLHKRARSLKAAHSLVQWLMQQLRYTAAPIQNLLQEAAREPAFSSLAFLTDTTPFPGDWGKGVSKSAKVCAFTEEDAVLLCRFGEGLGKTDLEGQLAHGAQYARLLDEQQQKAAVIAREKGRMVCMLWAAGAAVLALLLI